MANTPTTGTKITQDAQGRLSVPDQPILPFIEGDGTGPDIWRATKRVLDAAVEKSFGGEKAIAWHEILAGEKARDLTGEWLPEKSLEAMREYRVGIKGPLTTPVGGGFRSLNVALRQLLDLYACVRPVRYYNGVPSPVKEPGRVDMVISQQDLGSAGNGIAFSPDYKKVYIVARGGVVVADVTTQNKPANLKLFSDFMIDGIRCGPDGIRLDVYGNLWSGSNAGNNIGYSGVTVWSPEGKLLGRIRLPEVCANVAFGGPKRNRLFMAAGQSLYAVYTNTQGASPG